MFAGARRLSNLVNIVDVNRTQADGELVLEIEPLTEKYRAFGWSACDVDGNDVDALLGAFAAARQEPDRPQAIVAHTRLAQGSPTVQRRGNAHFVRIKPNEWDAIAREIEESS
jgi:transketolase